jgi:hypothetical protein
MAFLMVSFRPSFDDAEVGEVSVALIVVETVADDEEIRDLEAGEVDWNLRAAAGWLVEKRTDVNAGRAMGLKQVEEAAKREPCIHDVLY